MADIIYVNVLFKHISFISIGKQRKFSKNKVKMAITDGFQKTDGVSLLQCHNVKSGKDASAVTEGKSSRMRWGW